MEKITYIEIEKRYSPDDSYYRLGPIHTCHYVRARETADWDLSLGPMEWVRAETGTAYRGVLWRREFSGVARVNKVTPVSLGYPLSVFNKHSTLKGSRSKICVRVLNE